MAPASLTPLPSGDKVVDSLNQIILDLGELHRKADDQAERLTAVEATLAALSADVNDRISAKAIVAATSRTWKVVAAALLALQLDKTLHDLHLFGL